MNDPLPQDLLAELDTISKSDSHPQIRVARRRPIDYLELTAPMRGAVLDVSARGMRIQTSEPLYVGSRRTFSLEDSMGRQQRVAGYVRWSRLSRTDRSATATPSDLYLRRRALPLAGRSSDGLNKKPVQTKNR